MSDVLILLGCPQVPAQSPLALYIADVVKDAGHNPVVASNPSAKQLVKASDMKGYYIKDYKDLDKTVNDIADGTVYPLIITLIHNDAGLTYSSTVAALSPSSVTVSVFFGEHAYELSEECEYETEKILAPVTHNTKPILTKLDEVLKWAVLNI